MKRNTRPIDPGLQQIADLEALIVRAHDEKVNFGASAADVARERPAVVQLAANIAERLRADYLAGQRAAEERAHGH